MASIFGGIRVFVVKVAVLEFTVALFGGIAGTVRFGNGASVVTVWATNEALRE